VKPGGAKCLVLGDSIVRKIGAANANMRVEGFPGIRTDQLCRVMENRDFGCSDSVVIHVGTNDIRRSRNLDYVMGEHGEGKVSGLQISAQWSFEKQRYVMAGSRCDER
jgi:hypothetical protein